jgi:thiosulfate/3-mercaptopyruvate sulfurtransferase
LVSADDLAAELASADSGIRVIDLRQRRDDGGPKIPESAWISLHDGFAQARADRNLHYDLPSPAEFAEALSRLGIKPQTRVVLADDMGNRWATRVYWLLQYYRHPGEAAVLDGGIAAWVRSGHPVVDEFGSPERSAYPPPTNPDESIRATSAQVVEGIAADELTICDVRTAEEYRGETVMSGRGGHIPGAINIPWDRSLRDDGTFLPNNLLAQVMAPYLDDRRRQVTYCQGGVRASLAWFVLQVLLGREARLYAASWEEWAQDPTLPVTLEASN